jgi:P4 family phage/plasmid primase-like protien
MKNPTKPKPLKPDELERLYVLYQSNVWESMVESLSEELEVSVTSINRLGVGYCFEDQCWIFAERDDRGQIIGLSKRYHDGSKFMVEGSKRGLVYECINTVEKGRVYTSSGFISVKSAGVDCPICGKDDWCMVSRDDPNNPSAAICPRTKEGSVKRIEDSGYLHKLSKDEQGVSHAQIISSSDKPYIVVEGASDVLAAMDLGHVGVGRPSAESGSLLVASLLRGKTAVIMGENDAGAGIRGMDRCFTQCKAKLKEVTKCLPPAAYKDLRKWKPTPEEFAAWTKQKGEQSDTSKLVHGSLDFINLAETFINNNGYAASDKHRLVYHHDDWWRYNKGKYERLDPLVLNAKVSETFHGFEYVDDVTEKVKPVTINSYFIKEVMAATRNTVLTKVPSDVLGPCLISSGKAFDSSHVILFRNGVLNVLTGELMPHSNNLFTTATLSYGYTPTAPCDLWLSTIEQWLNGDEERIALLQEWFGYNMTTSNYLEQLMFIYGESGSGKSTATRVLKYLLDGNSAPATVDQLTKDQFGLAPLVGKYAMFISEEDTVSNTQARKLLTIMKKVTGNDSVPIRRMHQTAVEGELFCKITYSSNSLPIFHDETQSLFRRYNLLNFNTVFGNNPNVTLYLELQKERQGIAAWAVEGLKRLLNNGGQFTRPSISGIEIDHLKEESSPIRFMFDHYTAWQPDLRTSKQELYALYEAICAEEHVKNPVGYRKFRRRCCEASQAFAALKESRYNDERGWWGFGVTEEARKRYLGG